MRATGALLLVGGMLTYVGVAGAAADHTVKAIGAGTSSHWDAPDITVQTGQSVMWDFSDASLPTPLSTHNVVSTNAVATDPRWEGFVFPGPGEFDQASTGTSVEYTFYKQGEYQYVCTLHGGPMQGKVTVEGADLPIPTPTATPTATPTVTATATPTVTPAGTPPPADDHTQTPAPKPAADTTKPTLSSLKLKGRKRAATVSFTLSENATVTVQIRKRGAKKVLRTVRLQANAGKRSVVLRSSKLRKGRYTVTLTARDAMGNASAASNASLRIRK